MTLRGIEIDMEINYHNRKFRQISNTHGDDSGVIFSYSQDGHIVTGTFEGGYILHGNLIGVMDEMGSLDIRYQYVDVNYNIVTGICHTTPTILADGQLRLYERWQQTSGNMDKGHSIEDEITPESETGSF